MVHCPENHQQLPGRMKTMEVQTPADWQQVHTLTLQGQQAQMEELARMRAQETEARIWLFTCQQGLSEKIKVQQVKLSREGEGARMPKMCPQDGIEAFLEATE